MNRLSRTSDVFVAIPKFIIPEKVTSSPEIGEHGWMGVVFWAVKAGINCGDANK